MPVFAAVSDVFDVVSVEVSGGGSGPKLYHFVGEIIDRGSEGVVFRSAGNHIYFFGNNSVIRLNEKGGSRKNEFPSGRVDIARFFKSISGFDAEFLGGGPDSAEIAMAQQAENEKKLAEEGLLRAGPQAVLPRQYKAGDYKEYKENEKEIFLPAVLGFFPGFGAGHFALGDFAAGAGYLAAQAGAAYLTFAPGVGGAEAAFYTGIGLFICAALLQSFTAVISAESHNKRIFEELQLHKINVMASFFLINENKAECRKMKAGAYLAF